MNAIRIRGAQEHNLKDLSLDIPRGRLTVFTGISGSGKSSLAFDTVYKEGRRRFLESLPSYARHFLGGFEKPRVESIEGLSPAVSIEQRTVGHSPRSTVGTITEIYDHLRLLFARLGVPHCPVCRKPIRSQSAEQVVDQLMHRFPERRLLLCAPVVRDRRGEFRKELEDLRRDGYLRVRIDGEIQLLGSQEMRLDRRQSHTLEVVYDRQVVRSESRARLVEGVEKCFALAGGVVNVVLTDAKGDPPVTEHLFSGRFACPRCGVDLPELEPRLFSFNSPHGACDTCKGLGETRQVDPELLIADPSRPLGKGGLAPVSARGRWLHRDLQALFEDLSRRGGFGPGSSWGDLREEARRAFFDGDDDLPGFPAAIAAIRERDPGFLEDLVRSLPCPDCKGERLGPLARAVLFQGRSLPELSALPAEKLEGVLAQVRLDGAEAAVGDPIIAEIRARLRFLLEVGLSYLTLERPAPTLAGGEAQRIRLASQVGSRLQGVVYVLDEPSIGLHPRDNGRLLRSLGRLRDLGNTVLVVEHDRATMEAADHLVDLGPGAGADGGELVAEGRRADIERESRSITGSYLSGGRSIEVPEETRSPGTKWLELYDVRHNNLKGIDVRIPLEVFLVVTGVSGSGKSSLINQVLRPALLRRLGRRGADPGRHRSLRGYPHVDKVIDIDQSPIGKTPRSNPATYTKVFGLIREFYAKLPESRARGYTPGRFSFNVEGGRCLECGGGGVTLVDMQFLAPVEIVCEVCGGRRYNRETLEILYRGLSISDVLDLTVDEALEQFHDLPRIARILRVMATVGLGYIRLGQPSTTLSGGESQRMKLAAELLKRDTGRTLYIFDEPTTGLHFDDIRVLLKVLHELVDRSNSVIVIEHNVDVVKSADYIIDLGPEAGDAGGEVVAQGTPLEIMATESSHTGRALKREQESRARPRARSHRERPEERAPEGPDRDSEDLIVRSATLNNLKAVDARIPRQSLTVVTGVSGSGKTSLAFDTIFAEGQRRYIESLSTYARQFLGRLRSPPVESISGLAPAIAIDQKSVVRGPRSTVATSTEIHDHLRLLYARAGEPHCPVCERPLTWISPTRLAAELVEGCRSQRLYVLSPVTVPELSSEVVGSLLALQLKAGFTRVLACGEEVRLDDEDASAPLRKVLHALRRGDREQRDSRNGLFVVVDRLVLESRARSRLAGSLEQAFQRGEGRAAVQIVGKTPVFHTRAPSCPAGHFIFDGQLTPRMFSFNSAEGACERCRGTGVEDRVRPERLFPHPEKSFFDAMDTSLARSLEKWRASGMQLVRALLLQLDIPSATAYRALPEQATAAILFGTGEERVTVEFETGSYPAKWTGLVPLVESLAREGPFPAGALDRFFERQTCSACDGRRLRPEILAVRIGGRNIQDVTALTITEAREFFRSLELGKREAEIAREVLREIENRLRFLEDVGLGYVGLDRPSATLSGGESRRIRLASQLGNRLAGVIYVLDEPTVGLHPRDTHRLLASLRELRDQGNTIILVEHDRETIEAADHVIDMGPGAGDRGGCVIAHGAPREIAACADSPTGRYLRGEGRLAERPRRRRAGDGHIELRGIRCHNLAGLHATIPLGVLTAVTGVSGSGKSTLVIDVLAKVLDAALRGRPVPAGIVRETIGLERVRRLAVVNQGPIGRTPKSTPATYTGLWTHVRKLFSSLTLSRVRGYGPSRFSFNSPEGRCPACDGQGEQLVPMHFLSDVWVVCDVCGGTRFSEATLEVRFRGKNISEVLELEVDQAADLFENQPRIHASLRLLQDVGLGYIKLGQSAATLSGGEAQRVKLASELADQRREGTLYVLDEPTTGLHFEDIRKLLDIFRRLVERGNTLVVIEHQLDVIAAADWVIELGPEAGSEGGRIVAQGPPEEIARTSGSHTGSFLKDLA